MAIKLTEQMPVACPESPARSLAPAAWATIAPYFDRVDAVALGPGLSRDPGAVELARRIAAEAPKPMVIDADALNALAGATELLVKAPAPRVLTPHLGEMSRLTGRSTESLEAARIDAPAEWARKWNAVVVMKGAPTVTAAPDGRTLVNDSGGPALATAGTGDVLTGTVAALLAQRLDAFDAGSLAAYVHGRAGDLAVIELETLGLVAGDVVDRIASATGMLELERDRRRG
jgi:NAD(P)H-hydrate epimerase